ncbi:MAG: NADH-quinone oxidoreductase subunit C [Candidatus Omnitrophota bacterium]|jgi:Ni,Fe-hydrogenase III large subunit
MDRNVFFRNGEVIRLASLKKEPVDEFRKGVLFAIRNGARIAAFFAKPGDRDGFELFLILAHDSEGGLSVHACEVGDRYPALTPDCPQAHLFEREIREQWGIVPEGHPWLKPVRFYPSPPGVCDFFKVEGESVHEVAVGPVHAGIIEPGHFRFQCDGETVLHLEIALGFQHRGVERSLRGGPGKRTLHTMETLAGDTTIGHAAAYCQMIEALSWCEAPVPAQAFRAIALELERLANHTGDLGALAGDIGYLPTSSYCGRIRGDFLNMTALFCGNRFGRGWLCPGGVAFDGDKPRRGSLSEKLETALKDVRSAVELLWQTPSVLARMEEIGTLSKESCEALGLVGPAARACGVSRDVRFDFPSGIYRFSQIPVSVGAKGDVFSRAYVRWLEIQRSVEFIREQIENFPEGAVRKPCGALVPDAMACTLTEGWRGEICHVAMTDSRGLFCQYKITDPSFHNWMGLALAMRDQQISDFPLCNKSFNLSYCGHDL